MASTTQGINATEATVDRVWKLLEVEKTMGMDSLVNLMVDAYEILAGVDDLAFAIAPRTEYGWRELRRTILNGSHYCEEVFDK